MAEDKFIWQKGDIELVDESTFKQNAKLYDASNELPYRCCYIVSSCVKCDEDDQNIAVALAKKIYDSFFATNKGDENMLNKVMKSYINLCKKILPEGTVLTKQLYCCARMKLFDILLAEGSFTEQQIKRVLSSNM